MNPQEFENEYSTSGVVLVVRLPSSESLDDIAQSASAAGIRFLEVTTNTPGAIEWLRSRSGRDATLRLGVGTVTDVRVAETAIEAGADFLVSPHVDVRLAEVSATSSVAYIPGALTPTEVLTAHHAGAAAVKVFPVSQLGPGYIRDLRGPLPDVPLITIGGITEENAASYVAAGATGVGIGSSFVSSASIADGDWELLTRRLAVLVERVAGAREGLHRAQLLDGDER